VQQSRGEDVAALAVGAKLDLVDREELDLSVERHRFDRAHKIARVRRQDFFFAGDQRDRARALELDDPIVIFPRQKPQREADHAALVIEHALDRQVGLTRIRRPQDRDQARSGALRCHAAKGAVARASGQAQT